MAPFFGGRQKSPVLHARYVGGAVGDRFRFLRFGPDSRGILWRRKQARTLSAVARVCRSHGGTSLPGRH